MTAVGVVLQYYTSVLRFREQVFGSFKRVMTLRLRNMVQDEQVEKAICIILRLPGLFLLESYCLINKDVEDAENTYLMTLPTVVQVLIVFVALLIITLPLEHLVTLYMHLLSTALLAVARSYSLNYVEAETSSSGDEAEYSTRNFEALLFHASVSAAITSMLDLEGNGHRTLLAAYTVPPSACIVGAPAYCLPALHFCASVSIGAWFLGYIFMKLPDLLVRFYHLGRVLVFQRISYVAIIQPMFVFWFLLIVVQLYKYCNPQAVGGSPRGALLLEQEWYLMLLYAVSEVCASPFSLAASCIAVTYISRFILMFTNIFAQGKFTAAVIDEHPRAGVSEGVTMGLLSLHIEMTHLAMPQRVGAMSVVLFIVLGSLVQSMHELTEPLLMRLCASHNVSKLRHFRLLLLCLFLLVFPLYMTHFLCTLFKGDFWTLVVVSTCALTSVQVMGSLIVYCLFMFDNLYKDSSWKDLDDLVYYARSLTRVLEFLVAVLVVGAGLRESDLMSNTSQPWSWVNSSILLVHCYCNVYLRLQAGWQSFLLRREASRRVGVLPTATIEQLAARAHDVCPVCYSEMTSACVTPCQHLFHAYCLRKWLYVQDSCPLCSQRILASAAAGAPDEPPRTVSDATNTSSGTASSDGAGTTVHSTSVIENAENVESDSGNVIHLESHSNKKISMIKPESESEIAADSCTSSHRNLEEPSLEDNNNVGCSEVAFDTANGHNCR